MRKEWNIFTDVEVAQNKAAFGEFHLIFLSTSPSALVNIKQCWSSCIFYSGETYENDFGDFFQWNVEDIFYEHFL